MAMTKGICRNAHCPASARATPIDRYEGPGEYCPECGEPLEPLEPLAESLAAAPPAGAPFGGLSALQALQAFEADEPPTDAPLPARPHRAKRPLIASVGIAAAFAMAIFVLHPKAVGQPGSSDAVRVCESSMTQRFAADAIRAYTEKSGVPASRFAFSGSGQCEVRFLASAERSAAAIVAHDGLVVVVNPANRLVRLEEDVVRRIYRGEITDWSQAGGAPGPIVAMLPQEGSDEATALEARILRGAPLGANVRRLASSAQVTRAVSRADGRGAIGIVAFSEAVPAKVLALGSGAVPSPLSIGDHRYSLALGLAVTSASGAREAALNLIQFVRSEDAQAIALRSGLVPKKGI